MQEVIDNGIGFEQKYAERIFQIFEHLHGRNTYEGTGIGLAICRKIAERHSSSLTAQSQLNQGATFTLTAYKNLAKSPIAGKIRQRKTPRSGFVSH